MKYEKIIKRPTGRQYLITVNIIAERLNAVDYRFDVYYREKGGRKWHNVPDTLYDFQLRGFSFEDKNKHRVSNYLRFVSAKEIETALKEAWSKIEPEFSHEECECTGCCLEEKYVDENAGLYNGKKKAF